MKIRNLLKLTSCGALMGLATMLSASAFAANSPDFNGDGFSDLAIGVPGEDLGAYANTGAIHVIYGTAAGLNAAGNQMIASSSCSWAGGVLGNQVGLQFGEVLAWGDFNGDGCDDLAIGMPSYDAGALVDVGMVYVLPGSPAGLVLNQTKVLVSTNLAPINVNMNSGDRFGAALAAGDFNGDGKDDLAIGVPGEEGWNGAAIPDAGEVYVVYGSAGGVNNLSAQGWSQNGKLIWPDIQDNPEAGDLFGHVLSAGDFNGDGKDDLAIGAPGEDVFTVTNAGAVHVLYGTAFGLNAGGSQFWHQNTAGVQDFIELNDRFGATVAAGDFNGDGKDDLAIGVTGEDLAVVDAGAVHVLYGTAGGLNAAGNQFWHQDAAGILDFAEVSDGFGMHLSAGDFNGDGRSDLAVGVPRESVGAVAGAGIVQTIYGNFFGLNAAGNQIWSQDSFGIPDLCEAGDAFGWN